MEANEAEPHPPPEDGGGAPDPAPPETPTVVGEEPPRVNHVDSPVKGPSEDSETSPATVRDEVPCEDAPQEPRSTETKTEIAPLENGPTRLNEAPQSDTEESEPTPDDRDSSKRSEETSLRADDPLDDSMETDKNENETVNRTNDPFDDLSEPDKNEVSKSPEKIVNQTDDSFDNLLESDKNETSKSSEKITIQMDDPFDNLMESDKNETSKSSEKIVDQTDDPFDSLMESDNNETSKCSEKTTGDPFDSLLESDKNETGPKSPQETATPEKHHIEDLNEETSEAMDTHDSTAVSNENDMDMEYPELGEFTDEDRTVGPGADEEVCLLPDTEREITEADKLKALAIKNSVKTEIHSNSSDASKDSPDPKSESHEDAANEDNDLSMERGTEEEPEAEAEAEAEDESLRSLPENEQDKDDEPEPVAEESIDTGIVQEICRVTGQACLTCLESKDCVYRLLVDNESKYICGIACVNKFMELNRDKYVLSHRRVTVSEIFAVDSVCFNCDAEGKCYYRHLCGEEVKYLCKEKCLFSVINGNLEKYKVRRKKKIISRADAAPEAECYTCGQTKRGEYEFPLDGKMAYLCSSECTLSIQRNQPYTFNLKRSKPVVQTKQPLLLKVKTVGNSVDKSHKIAAKTPEQERTARVEREKSFARQCAQCHEPYYGVDKNLSWETMDFCNEVCLGKYQNAHGLHCANCKNAVSMVSLGKYCVRFGYDIRQFCCSGCLDEFKKGLKICCYCQKDISSGYEGFLAPVGDQGQFKDFCSQFCVEKFDQMSKNPIPPPVWAQCDVCSQKKLTEVEVQIDAKSLRLCSEPCFAAFKFVNKIFPDQCQWCKKYFERKSSESYTIYSDTSTHCFCSKTCMNVYISNSRHIVPCNWCKVKKYNFDMIRKTQENGQSMMMCSLNCLTLYQVSINAVSSRRIKCDQCKHTSQAHYHLTMSDATIRDFCSYQCVMSFQSQYNKTPVGVEDSHTKGAVPTGAPRRTYGGVKNIGRPAGLPVISSVKSLAPPTSTPGTPSVPGHATRAKSKRLSEKSSSPHPQVEPPKSVTPPPPPPPQIYNHVVVKPMPPKDVRNMATMTKPYMCNKSVSCRPQPCNKEVQTDDYLQRRILVPVPVPIYVPTPMAMYSFPLPVPVPIPLPIPVPVFIPTTRNSANGIMKEIKKIHEKMPTDPFEAELLMMAEMVAGEKKKCESDSESDEENGDDGFSPDGMDTGNPAFGEDVLQMALKMATEYEEPAVDLESAMTASTITPSSHPSMPCLDENNPMHHHQLLLLEQQRAAAAATVNAVNRKRGVQGGAGAINASSAPRSKRSRRAPDPPPPTHHPPPEPPREPEVKPDALMCLKYTFGVNAWKQWVMTKNAEMEKSSIRRKPFKSEILQLTADELNYSLCLFVKEVRKPNGSEYAPDTIYYLVLGIQQYLFENGRIDNIFTDTYYEKFTECLDEVARKFSVLYNDSQYIVTRVEEEHLWESKQLGAHSPHVLLSTLMFFNTKHFNLVTVEEHMQLSFSHIMKHWKRNPNQPGAAKIPGARNVLLRFYPPQSALEANSRKKKVYEQQENEENPLRCPVKLYEFYISKCPESVKTRNDVFYLMPERSCVPDSPVWYSTQALGREPLSKMLHRVKMVKEINIALLTS